MHHARPESRSGAMLEFAWGPWWSSYLALTYHATTPSAGSITQGADMQNPDDYKGYFILGANVRVILDGFGTFTLLASKILLESGLGTMDADGVGHAVINPDQWYPL